MFIRFYKLSPSIISIPVITGVVVLSSTDRDANRRLDVLIILLNLLSSLYVIKILVIGVVEH